MKREEVLAEIGKLRTWRHRIQVSENVVTPGLDDNQLEMRRLRLPGDCSGLRVLDVGCSDGFYSFECERRGARSVLAVDDFSSLMNPGANGFEIARRLLNSRVEFLQMSVYDLDPHEIGTFDLVLFLNVIYHLRHPLLALEKISALVHPGGFLYLKSYFVQDFRITVRGRSWGFDWSRRPKLSFYEKDELAGDPTNWWGPNQSCLEALARSAGFDQVVCLTRAGDRVYYRCRKPVPE